MTDMQAIRSYDTKPTSSEYTAFQAAYDSYNAALFGGALPDCLITLQRKRGALGYFWASQFTARSGPGETDEIALNPEGFHDTETEILSTLVHEMAHHPQGGYPGSTILARRAAAATTTRSGRQR